MMRQTASKPFKLYTLVRILSPSPRENRSIFAVVTLKKPKIEISTLIGAVLAPIGALPASLAGRVKRLSRIRKVR
jgi:hypothetical protein